MIIQPAVSEVSSSLQPNMDLFSCGEQADDVKVCDLRAQSLDALLVCSPKHPPNYTLGKEFHGKQSAECLCTAVWVR